MHTIQQVVCTFEGMALLRLGVLDQSIESRGRPTRNLITSCIMSDTSGHLILMLALILALCNSDKRWQYRYCSEKQLPSVPLLVTIP